ncbi:hypothetical protein VTN31DRAFT_5583 [Thermomyces dupontii]|uniref:uncharacterized protein n=1 Tax=Talaromyces thermophilus TaxID=28565 RepID=UPI0037425F18
MGASFNPTAPTATRPWPSSSSIRVLFIPKPAAMHLEYDYSVDRLSVRWIREPLFSGIIYDFSACLTPNLVYRFSTMTGQVAAYNATTGTVTRRSVWFPGNHVLGNRPSLGSNLQWQTEILFDRPQAVFGDCEVFGLVNDSGIQLWFFNPSFVPDLIPDGSNVV